MARLTTFSRVILSGAIASFLFFGIYHFLKKNDKVNQLTAKSQSDSKASTTVSSFDFTPPDPVNGKRVGIILCGAQGFDGFVLNQDGKRWKLESEKRGNTLFKEGLASESDIKTQLKEFIADLIQHGVDGKDIHFLVSSGAKKEDNAPAIIAALKNMKYIVNEATPQREAEYGFKTTVPNDLRNNSFFFDLGSGNGKLAWSSELGITTKETPGAKYAIGKNPMSDDAAITITRNAINQIPPDKSGRCFVIGGVPYKIAKSQRKGKERYTVINLNNFETTDPKEINGLKILKTIENETQCKLFIFDWDANFCFGQFIK